MGYLIFFLIMMVIISIFPYLMEIVIFFWIISMVINLFSPNRRRRTFTQQQDYTEQQAPRPRNNGDVIDVEFTQRDDDNE